MSDKPIIVNSAFVVELDEHGKPVKPQKRSYPIELRPNGRSPFEERLIAEQKRKGQP